jgi:DNA-binding CsgD family transcriptional regulator
MAGDVGIMAQLTPREREIVGLLRNGRRQREIAAELCVVPGTVKMHLYNARVKAGARTTVELVAKVVGEGE